MLTDLEMEMLTELELLKLTELEIEMLTDLCLNVLSICINLDNHSIIYQQYIL